MAKIDILKEHAKEHLEADETILAAVMGAYKIKNMGKGTLRNGIFLATDRRIVFYGKRKFSYDLEVYPYENISAIEVEKELTGHKISLFALENKIMMNYILTGDIAKFIEHTKGAISRRPHSAYPQAPVDAADQIKKSADLHGIRKIAAYFLRRDSAQKRSSY